MKIHAGDWVEVRSADEILTTLDKNGRLEGLPFMPQMFGCCDIPFPRLKGKIPLGDPTPRRDLGLQPGDLVVDTRRSNRGLAIDAEIAPFCGKVFRVGARIDRLVDERRGRMRYMKRRPSPSTVSFANHATPASGCSALAPFIFGAARFGWNASSLTCRSVRVPLAVGACRPQGTGRPSTDRVAARQSMVVRPIHCNQATVALREGD